MVRQVGGVTGRLGLAVVWVTATAVAGAVAWSAVGGLGQAAAGSSAALSQSQVRRDLAQQAPRSVAPTGPAGSNGTPTGTRPTPSTGPTSSTGPTPSTSPTTPPPGGQGSGASTGTSGTGSSTTQAQPPRRSRSWTLAGGDVGVACSGDVISLVYASPRDGWSMQLAEQGPATVSVTFSRGESEEQFQAVCTNGTPTSEGGQGQGYGGGSGSGSGNGDGGGGE